MATVNPLADIGHTPTLMPTALNVSVLGDKLAEALATVKKSLPKTALAANGWQRALICLRVPKPDGTLELWTEYSTKPAATVVGLLDNSTAPQVSPAGVWVYASALAEHADTFKGQRVDMILNPLDEARKEDKWRKVAKPRPVGLKVHQPLITYQPLGQRVSHWMLRKRWQSVRRDGYYYKTRRDGWKWREGHRTETFYAPRKFVKTIYDPIVTPRAAVRMAVGRFKARLWGKVGTVNDQTATSTRATVWRVSVNALDLHKSLGAGEAMSPDNYRPVLQGVLVRPTDAGTLEIVSADGYRLHHATLPMTVDTGKLSPAIAHRDGWLQFVKTLPKLSKKQKDGVLPTGDIKFEYSYDDATPESGILTALDGYGVVLYEMPCVEGKYPPIESVIPKWRNTVMLSNLPEWLATLKRLELYARDSANAVRVCAEWTEGLGYTSPKTLKLVLTAKSQERGDAEEVYKDTGILGALDSDQISGTFDVRYMIAVVKWAIAAGEGLLRLDMGGKSEPVRWGLGNWPTGDYEPRQAVGMPMSR